MTSKEPLLTYSVVDLETSVNNTGEDAIGKNKASPYHPDNKVVLDGALMGHLESNSKKRVDIVKHIVALSFTTQDKTFLVGHNIGFDLLYYKKHNTKEYNKVISEVRIWDTMIVEYLLTGQQDKFMSLDKLSTRYGGTLKDNRIKDFWVSGVKTEDIPEEMLSEYLEQDLRNTELIFREQMKKVLDDDKLDLVMAMMDSRLATTAMEFSGMFFDKKAAKKEQEMLTHILLICEESLDVQIYIAHGGTLKKEEVNTKSKEQISRTLFGGVFTYKVDVPMLDDTGKEVLFKSGPRKGQVRTKKETHTSLIKGLCEYPPLKEWETKKEGVYKVDEHVLSRVLDKTRRMECNDFIKTLMEIRKLQKDITTYYEGFGKLVWPDGLIHPNFNHAATSTGRLSSSGPNFQNLANSKE